MSLCAFVLFVPFVALFVAKPWYHATAVTRPRQEV